MHACMHAHARTSTHTRVRARTSRHVLRQVQHSRARARAHTHTRTHTRTRTRTGIYTHNARTRAQDAMRQQGQFIRKPDGIPDKNFVGLDCLRTFNTHPHSQHRAAKFRLAGGATGARRAPAPQPQFSARCSRRAARPPADTRLGGVGSAGRRMAPPPIPAHLFIRLRAGNWGGRRYGGGGVATVNVRTQEFKRGSEFSDLSRESLH